VTTTGELLVSLSDLSTGTALEHLQNITGGGGGVTGIALADFADLVLEPALDLEVSFDDVLDVEGSDDVRLSGDDGMEIADGEELELDR